MPPVAVERNSVLAAATLAYFTGVHSPRKLFTLGLSGPALFPALPFTSEMMVGFLFTAGCVLPLFTRPATVSWASLVSIGIPALFFAHVAWINCYAINRWESCKGKRSRSNVFSRASLLAGTGLILRLCCFQLIPVLPPSSYLARAARLCWLYSTARKTT